jgi:hypothetical protein
MPPATTNSDDLGKAKAKQSSQPASKTDTLAIAPYSTAHDLPSAGDRGMFTNLTACGRDFAICHALDPPGKNPPRAYGGKLQPFIHLAGLI